MIALIRRLERAIGAAKYEIRISRGLAVVRIKLGGKAVVSCQGDGADKVIDTAIATWKANYGGPIASSGE